MFATLVEPIGPPVVFQEAVEAMQGARSAHERFAVVTGVLGDMGIDQVNYGFFDPVAASHAEAEVVFLSTMRADWLRASVVIPQTSRADTVSWFEATGHVEGHLTDWQEVGGLMVRLRIGSVSRQGTMLFHVELLNHASSVERRASSVERLAWWRQSDRPDRDRERSRPDGPARRYGGVVVLSGTQCLSALRARRSRRALAHLTGGSARSDGVGHGREHGIGTALGIEQ